MGYTHYWDRPSVLPRPQFIAAVADCRRLCAALGLALAGANGKGRPTFSDDEICFNGLGDSSYEAFCVKEVVVPRYTLDDRQSGWSSDFCKTNHLPYDLCVQGCLIVLSHHLGMDQFQVSSDGNGNAWDDARAACQRILRFGANWGSGKLAPLPPSSPLPGE